MAGFVLAVAATAVVFLTDNPQLLRLAVVAAAWAFVLAALVSARRGAGTHGPATGEAAAREAELRLAYELELEREAAARQEYELRLEKDLRHEAEESMRAELDALRGELAQVAELRRDMAQVAELRRDMAQVGELRGELAQVGELRRDVAQLAELRVGLAQLADLRADLGKLTEQLSGEMLIERIMLRTQTIRTGPATVESLDSRTIDAAVDGDMTWAAEPAAPTRQLEEARVEQPVPAPEVTAAFAATPPPPPLDWLTERSLVEPEEASEARRARHARLDPEPGPAVSEPRRRRTDGPAAVEPAPVAAGQLTVERPVAQRERPPVPGAGPAEPEGPAGSGRLAEILAESGVSPSSGGRRRRRYREDDEADDVLARVLGRS
ncbi:DUF6779 domain-containing protein [Geodermatophilus ruber]|uniref:DUF6779 domain-containing protein n=1 Tax=Geodermatophilus ruber TaxID=504800 RepID=UPI0011605191|nr:DUF6779 domain-containing protein [Geodermatophilus ruber]